ncbi:hypothetical protein J8281_18055 [Aquimarina sp. U1-2]|uniref:hypothetical protein n=1 Tax=Aquimarina sp. U1-2 TaxID=2823141 RepID=UPI001AECF687|nr:hypothetical protein [Aquimarina sp. U1-2]MBP2834106.1 hypothetical protein [Aquimarina sp. U1-2]
MKNFYFYILILILVLSSCNHNKQLPVGQDEQTAKLDSLSKAKINLNLLQPSPQAQEDLKNFEDFENLQHLITTLQASNPYYIRKRVDSLSLLIQTFEENLSEDLNVNTINSRLTVLNTEVGLLQLLSESKQPNPENFLKANTRIIKAYNSLIIQLNELSLAIPDAIEKELLREEENK